ncbi:uncharacterized protein LOC123305471 [Chrysoperla carnea]|uniref:uncharacterized protein LOC123305471 n=1 Tax=Chrysoperla carnea TaxID=189513 RepID=UPI001D05F9EB|nr:uncharacterized protein LOC123305471 [Chrysoperla carnea]
MVSERLLQLSQPLERRLNVKYDQLKMRLDSPRVSNYSSKPSSLFYDRLMTLAEPRYRCKKYVNPEIEYISNKTNINSCKKFADNRVYYNACSSSSATEVTNMRHFNKIIKNRNKREKNLIKLHMKTPKMKESDQVTRMNRKTYVAIDSNEEKKPKQIAEERLVNLATPRYRREKFIDSNAQYDVNYHSSQLMKKLSQMNKQAASSSLSSQYRTNNEVLQLAEDIRKYKNDVITEMIIPKYLRKQPQIDDDFRKVSKLLNKKSVSNEYNDDDIFNRSFIRTQSELRFLRKQIILSRKFKTRVSPIKKFPTTILWHFTKSKKKRGTYSKKLSKINTNTNYSETCDGEKNSEQPEICGGVKNYEKTETFNAEKE